MRRDAGRRGVKPARMARSQIGDGHASTRLKSIVSLKNLIFVFALILFVWLIWYFYTGCGGAQELVSRLMPIALILQILFMYQEDYLYKWLPPIANHVAGRRSTSASASMPSSISGSSTKRSRSTGRAPTRTQDFVVGLLMFLLVMELSRLAHPGPVLGQRRARSSTRSGDI